MPRLLQQCTDKVWGGGADVRTPCYGGLCNFRSFPTFVSNVWEYPQTLLTSSWIITVQLTAEMISCDPNTGRRACGSLYLEADHFYSNIPHLVLKHMYTDSFKLRLLSLQYWIPENYRCYVFLAIACAHAPWHKHTIAQPECTRVIQNVDAPGWCPVVNRNQFLHTHTHTHLCCYLCTNFANPR